MILSVHRVSKLLKISVTILQKSEIITGIVNRKVEQIAKPGNGTVHR